MGIFDNLASRISGNAYDDYDDDDIMDDDYDDVEDEPHGKRSIFSRSKSRTDEEEDDTYDQQPQGRAGIRPSNSRSGNSAQLAPVNRSRQVPVSSGKTQVRVIKPSSFDQARQITDTLLVHRTVILNLEGLDVSTAQRIVDFASGSCYALHGNFMKISHYIIVITPEDVDIAGDVNGGRPDGVSGILANAAAQGAMNGMGGMNGMSGMGGMGSAAADGSANPFVNNTINMGSAY
jgi:cell division inhibitor SepF